jgi:hypothetical protein
MKRSQLREIVLEAMTTPVQEIKTMKNTSITNLLKEIMTGDADKMRAEHLGNLRGNLMHIIALLNAERPYEEVIAYVKKALSQVESSNPLSEGDDQQTYVVHYRVGEDDDDDVEVKASSAEEAIEKAKSGKTAGGQNMPRLARSFSAKLK